MTNNSLTHRKNSRHEHDIQFRVLEEHIMKQVLFWVEILSTSFSRIESPELLVTNSIAYVYAISRPTYILGPRLKRCRPFK
jgi:hypothetical protein